MRDIEFRVWDGNEKNFIHFGVVQGVINECDSQYIHNYIHIGTIEQYTGMKDKNGNKIFEGDILASESDGIDPSGGECDKWESEILHGNPVHWNNKFCCFDGLPDIDFDSMYHKRFVEIIGNIHEDNWLLEK